MHTPYTTRAFFALLACVVTFGVFDGIAGRAHGDKAAMQAAASAPVLVASVR